MAELIGFIFIFFFGAIVGSFLNVVIYRYQTGNSIIFFGSRCLSCGKNLSWYELIPIFSFFLQRGRCRECKSRISIQYPIVEATTGIVFSLVAYKIFPFFRDGVLSSADDFQFLHHFLLFLFHLLFFSLLIIISAYDFRHQIIPAAFVYPLIILSFLSIFLDFGYWNFLENWGLKSDSANRFLAGPVLGAFFGALWLVSKGKWMGLGDAKLALSIGWYLGLAKGLLAVVFSFWLGGLIALFLLIFFPKNFTLKSKVPFAPFLALATFLAFYFGKEILQIYFLLWSI
ncbi:MAG: prepilin peptidase [Minisyncoccales bacterium]